MKSYNYFESKIHIILALADRYWDLKVQENLTAEQKAKRKNRLFDLYCFVKDCYSHILSRSEFAILIEGLPKDLLKELYKEAQRHGDRALAEILEMAAEGRISRFAADEKEREEKREKAFQEYYRELIKNALKDKKALLELYGVLKGASYGRTIISYDELSIELLEKLLEVAEKKKDLFTIRQLEEKIHTKKEIERRQVRGYEDSEVVM